MTVCMNYKCWNMIEQIFQKELILIKLTHQKSVIFVTIGIFFKKKLLNLNFNDVAIVSIKGNDYRIHFWYMSKDDAIV